MIEPEGIAAKRLVPVKLLLGVHSQQEALAKAWRKLCPGSTKKSWAALKQNALYAGLFLGVALVFLMTQGTELTPLFPATDEKILNILASIDFEPIQWYVRSLAEALARFYGG